MGLERERPCRKCGRPIAFIKSEFGRGFHVVDVVRKTFVLPNGRVVHGYTSHFATCDDAPAFRRPLKTQADQTWIDYDEGEQP